MSETKKSSARTNRIFDGKLRRYVLWYAAFFALSMSLLKILDIYWDTGGLTVTARLAFTFNIWLLGGGIVGYLAWKDGCKK